MSNRVQIIAHCTRKKADLGGGKTSKVPKAKGPAFAGPSVLTNPLNSPTKLLIAAT
jgi:hypothetical protein